MKILLITPNFSASGAPVALLQLANYFVQKKHQVFIIGNDGIISDQFVSIGVVRLPLTTAVFNEKFDLYVANTILAADFAYNHAPKEKVVCWIHETAMMAIDMLNKGETLKRIERAIFQSQFQIAEFDRINPSCKKHHLRNYVPSIDFVNSTSSSIAVTGMWEKRKNQEFLLQVVDEKNYNICFNFIGADKPKNLPLKFSNHNFWGKVPPTVSRNLIANSFSLISASISETQNLSAIEAILSKIPIMLSDIPAHQELRSLIPSTILFNIDDRSSFHKCYLEMIDQKKNVTLLEQSKNLAIKYFGWDAFSKSCDNIFSDFLE